ncbi:hypothetical protein H9X86_01330 [Pseudoflavonifractor capillosus]|uniref:hypothetical protein n=1 Tax=Pseudoflavonifractor capillosus TaxID=106588 RepID=UPI0019599BB4|nr:hypothetical protein [Pseudoflavonifractor capillosus]MBM6896016.1 hypothetical protein [Pseudoflavonifractor capillosus]
MGAYLVLGLLAALGLLALSWLVLGRLLLPIPLALTVSLKGYGDGEGLEQGVKALHWMRRTGLWRGEILILDGGMSPQGLEVARHLVEEYHAQLNI